MEILYSIAIAIFQKDEIKLKKILNVLDKAVEQLSIQRRDNEEDNSFVKAIKVLYEEAHKREKELILTPKRAIELFQRGDIDWIDYDYQARNIFKRLGFKSRSHRIAGRVKRGYKIEKSIITKWYKTYFPNEDADNSVTSVTSVTFK